MIEIIGLVCILALLLIAAFAQPAPPEDKEEEPLVREYHSGDHCPGCAVEVVTVKQVGDTQSHVCCPRCGLVATQRIG